MKYSFDSEFKAKARLHQAAFRVSALKAGWEGSETRLARVDALAGKNFYLGFPEIFQEAQRRFPLGYTALYYDMLRSQHIPWNVFGPLMLERDFALALINSLFGVIATEIDAIFVEYAPRPKSHFLDDNTSFDAFVQYRRADGQKGAVGVEVKFTEREYPYGATEKKRMFDQSSRYNAVSIASELYKPGAHERLRTRQLKQLWRNQLLGEAMLLHGDPKITSFTSSVLYPSANVHCAKACQAYAGCLVSKCRETVFRPITFERFIEVGEGLATSDHLKEWLRYLSARYIVLD